MNLKFHLLSRMLLITALCLIVTAGYLLHRAERETLLKTEATADAIDKQLKVQWMRIDSGFDRPERFPDLDLTQQTLMQPGQCIEYRSGNEKLQRSLCRGPTYLFETVPNWFSGFYRNVFDTGHEISRQVFYNGRDLGTIAVVPHAEQGAVNAWQILYGLMSLAASSCLALCALVYVVIGRALKPAQTIVTGLEKMQRGDLSFRLPDFDLTEWQRTGIAVNRLVAHLEQTLAERRHLALKLMTVQEEERRYLTRELHDELGQCLAAIQAVAAAMSQTAANECPGLVSECRNISQIADHTMTSLRRLLLRLRPAELDELGLTASLKSLIAGWNAGNGGKVRYRLDIQGHVDALSDPIPITVFRIVQEGLTNIARHASATEAAVRVQVNEVEIECGIEDNGIADRLPFTSAGGIGLIGIRERVGELGGHMELSIGKPSGLIVGITLPLRPSGLTNS